MAKETLENWPSKPVALVDMGSNGIRFSISRLGDLASRLLPTIYHHRVGISLHDAQHSPSGALQPIPDSIITQVVAAFRHFGAICADFRVANPADIRVLATEATRTAPNSEELQERIREATGWTVELLTKGEEGRIGAWGVAASFDRVSGLVMDLGGGSVQMSWMIARLGNVQMGQKESVSLPYGAAALTTRLEYEEKEGLKKEIQERIKNAYEELLVPRELVEEARERGGMDLYLSGGGFRGWGYVLMSQHVATPYPIPIINGFTVSGESFANTESVQAAVLASRRDKAESIFQVSKRRADQVPAVAFLISCLLEALPVQIKDVVFSQGGVREGALYQSLRQQIRFGTPLIAAEIMYAPEPVGRGTVVMALSAALPPTPPPLSRRSKVEVPKKPDVIDWKLLQFLIATEGNFAELNGNGTKETTASAALRITTSGTIAGILQLRHVQRAAIALALCARYGGSASLPPEDQAFFLRMQSVAGLEVSWWCNYIGYLCALIGDIYPSGWKEGKPRLNMNAEWIGEKGKPPFKKHDQERGQYVLSLSIRFANGTWREAGNKALRKIEDMGKRKNWIQQGEKSVGWEIRLEVS